jgi:hypothetical protein
MKNKKLIILGIILVGVMLSPAQPIEPPNPDRLERHQRMAEFSEASAIKLAQADRIATAADYLRMALVLGLGMLIGRMSAVSYRELTEVKATLQRLADRNNQ